MCPVLMAAAEVVASGNEERIEALEISYGLEVDWWALGVFIYEARFINLPPPPHSHAATLPEP